MAESAGAIEELEFREVTRERWPDLARSHGADIVEGYPVDADSPSYGFMGRRSTFAAAGFEEVGRGAAGATVRLSLPSAATDTRRS